MSMPGFTAGISLYKTTAGYRLASLPSTFGASVVPAICVEGTCGPCINGTRRCCVGGVWVSEECGAEPPPPPVTCSPCLLPTDKIRQKILAGQPINPATDLFFQRTCQQGTNPPFTQSCEICSQETKIGLPLVSDKCIKVCMSGFDPASIRVLVRDC
jgi:hypothetical protein